MSDEYVYWITITVAFCFLAVFADALYMRLQARREKKSLEDERTVEKIKAMFAHPVLSPGEVRYVRMVMDSGRKPNFKIQYKQQDSDEWQDY